MDLARARQGRVGRMKRVAWVGLILLTVAACGSGKGAVEYWVVRVKPGRILFELDGVGVQLAKEALALAAAKLPIKTRFVQRIME